MTNKVYNFNPYCGNFCATMTRSSFDGEQFYCKKCDWKSKFHKGFIDRYKRKVEAEELEETNNGETNEK